MAHLLIVDDDEQMVGALTRVFQQAGYTVSSELDAAGARARLQRERPDLVILDVMFPEDASAGFELARSIREIHPDMKDVPILMLTAVNTRFPPLGFGSQDINDTWLPVEDFVEKPSVEDAPSNLAIAGRYVLTPEIFEYIKLTQPGKNNEIQLTDAMRLLVASRAMYGLRFDGRRYDIGNKLDFIKTNIIYIFRHIKYIQNS